MTKMRASVHDFSVDECRLFEGTKCTKCDECKKKDSMPIGAFNTDNYKIIKMWKEELKE